MGPFLLAANRQISVVSLMIWLGIDTATSFCRVGLWHSADARLIASEEADIGMGHAEILMAQMDMLLAKTSIARQDISQIVCSIGPGSFTGVRVGLSAAKALAQALHIPLIGVTTLESLALDAAALSEVPFTVAIDARRGQAYMQDCDADGRALSAPDIVAMADFVADTLCFAGSGGALLSENALLPGESGGSLRSMMLAARDKTPNTQPLVPLYLRGADAKQPKIRFDVARQAEAKL